MQSKSVWAVREVMRLASSGRLGAVHQLQMFSGARIKFVCIRWHVVVFKTSSLVYVSVSVHAFLYVFVYVICNSKDIRVLRCASGRQRMPEAS